MEGNGMTDGETTRSPCSNVPDGVVSHSIRPRFYEIDGQGVMFNMWYLAYVDEAVDVFFIKHGLPYSEWPTLGIDVHVAHVEIDWTEPIRYTDRPEVLVSTGRIGRKSFTLDFAFCRDGAVAATGCVVYVAVATDGSGTTPLPPRLVLSLGKVRPLRA